MPVSVTVTILMAATLCMDAADVRLAGWVSTLGVLVSGLPWSWECTPQEMTLSCLPQAHAATCLAQRAFGEPTAAILAPAKMGVLVYPRMATVCVHQGSEAPSARSVRLPVPHPLLVAVQIQEPESIPWLLSLTPISRTLNPGEGGRGDPGQGPQVTRHPFPQPASLVAMANAVCLASATTTLPATLRTGPATAWQAGQALTVLNVRSGLCVSRSPCCLGG